MTTMTTRAATMGFLGIRISSPHSSAQRTLRPIPRIAQRPEPSEARTPVLEAVLNTEAGAQLRELRDVPRDEESVEEWRVGMARERAEQRAEDLGDNLEEYPEHHAHG